MKILGYIEVKKTSREEFEAKYPKHTISCINDNEFLCWCNMCPEPIFMEETFVFIDDDNNHVIDSSSQRKAHATHFYPELEK